MNETEHQQVLSGEGIVCLSSIDWDFIWQQNQEIMSRFAKAGTPVLFIENTGVRAPGLRDVPRPFARLGSWWRGATLAQARGLAFELAYYRFKGWL